eukprot:CAMPEP_0202813034 /NCGR_PEP_ID=MMETSP1389-20130828/4551_1 /ASSEMBLY_ACC=CAM_ASM_000865 /TAXON_ID=302021 /ORGANISM="Rhodomonas sp., Strain CCMP768" /LENGTH=47 /DNA_ID= /DNA_START= /DNA_END= /DNA_ORIENTATION=
MAAARSELERATTSATTGASAGVLGPPVGLQRKATTRAYGHEHVEAR